MPNFFKFLTFIVFSTLISAAFTNTYQYFSNRLYLNPSWKSHKLLLNYAPLMGAENFINDSVTLAQNKLNLGAWHGFHRVEYKKNLDIRGLTVDFEALNNPSMQKSGVYFSFIGVELRNTDNPNLFYGIRLSPHLSSFSYTRDSSGKYLTKAPLEVSLSEDINSLKLTIRKNQIEVDLNNNHIKNIITDYESLNNLILLGGNGRNYIHSASIESTKGLFRESFSNPLKSYTYPTLLFIFLFLQFLFLNRLATTKGFYLSVTIGLVELFIVVVIHLSNYYYFSHQYFESNYLSDFLLPSITISDYKEHKEIRSPEGYIKNEFDLILDQVDKSSKRSAQHRLMFIGGSQTYGEGLDKKDQSWTKLFCQEKGLKCLNAAVRSATTHHFVKYYKELLEFNPTHIFMVFGINDDNSREFEKNLKQMVKINKEKKIKTCLIIEPKSSFYENLPNDLTMRRLAVQNEVCLINAHSEMLKVFDSGHIWWDIAHLTEYGHQLMNKIVSEALNKNRPKFFSKE